MNEDLKHNLTRRSSWVRILYMLLFAIVFSVGEFVFSAVVLVQLGFVLVTSRPNARLLEFGGSLSAFLYQIFLFLSFNSEALPFPFSPWPPAGAAPRLDIEG
jgi:hypothetical protein